MLSDQYEREKRKFFEKRVSELVWKVRVLVRTPLMELGEQRKECRLRK